jgi:PAS domain S-box-containing protein
MKFLEETPREPALIGGFQAFAAALPCIVWIADADGKTEWFNDEFRKYTGLALQTVVQWTWMSVIHVDDRDAVARDWQQARSTATLFDSVIRLRGHDGSYRWFRIRARPFCGSNGEIERWFGIFTDIHDRQLAFEAKAHVVDVLMQGYLSKTFPVVEGLTFDALYRAANVLEKVGGDWYDIFALPDGRIGFSLGDVCGHGVEAAVKMGEAKQAIVVAACLGDPAPDAVMHQANRVLFLNTPDVSMTTALYGVIDTKTRTVTYASAGHHPPLIASLKGDAFVLPNHGFPLGVQAELPLMKTHAFRYERGSMMVLYTDGLVEFARDMEDAEKRLLLVVSDALRCGAERPGEFIADHVLRDALPTDDIAILTIRFD